MAIVDRICIAGITVFLLFGAGITYRRHLTERPSIAAQADMANARASLPTWDDFAFPDLKEQHSAN